MKRYNSINGLRTIACIAIVVMHVKSNINYELPGKIANVIIDSFAQFVFLFMIISAFSMCCGYYEKIKNNEISVEAFYKKRFLKIIPFFLALTVLDVFIKHNIHSLIEGFANITGMFGFIGKAMDVIGVAWYLGLTFIFYMIFPFFVFLFYNKKRAICVTTIAFIMNITANTYFELDRKNMYFSFIFFCIGGLIYLYKDKIEKVVGSHNKGFILLTLIGIISYYVLPNNNLIQNTALMIIFMLMLIVAIGLKQNKILDNKITQFISGISLEIYLAHMVVFRILEKIQLTHIFTNNWASYIATSCLTLLGVTIGAIIFHKICDHFNYVCNKKRKEE